MNILPDYQSIYDLKILNSSLFIITLLLTIVLFVFVLYKLQLKQKIILNFLNESRKVDIFGCFLAFIALISLSIASSLPYIGYKEITGKTYSEDIFFVIDLSKSMLAKDIGATRLDTAKKKIYSYMQYLKNNNEEKKVGIILFSSSSYVYCPLTFDFSVIDIYLDSVSSGLISSGGSNISESLKLTIESLNKVKSQKAKIIVFTDGEDNDDPELTKSFEVVKKNEKLLNGDYKLIIYGAGTKAGSPIEIADSVLVKDYEGNTVITRLDEEGLKKLVSTVNGNYFNLSLNNSEISDVLSVSSTLNASNKTFKIYNDKSFVFTLISLVIFILIYLRKSIKSTQTLGTISLIIFLLSFPLSGNAQENPIKATSNSNDLTNKSLRDGYNSYNSGDYETAKQIFEKNKLDSNKIENKQIINNALAKTYFKLQNYGKAESLFSEVLKNSQTPNQKFDSYYNRGNTFLQEKEYDKAIKDYENALQIKNGDDKTTHNLEVAKKLKEKQKAEEKENKKEDKKDENKKNQDKNKQDKNQQNNKKDQDSKNKDQDKSKPNQEKDDEKNDNKKDENKDNQGDKSEDKQEDKKDDLKKESKNQENKNAEDKNESENQAEEAKTNEPKPEENKDGNIKEMPTPSNEKQASANKNATYNEKGLKENEAKAWLNSLPDSQILLRQKTEYTNRTGKNW